VRQVGHLLKLHGQQNIKIWIRGSLAIGDTNVHFFIFQCQCK